MVVWLLKFYKTADCLIITPPPKGATLSGLSDLRMSKEEADFLGTLFESLNEAGNSIFELGLVGGTPVTVK